MKEAKYCRNCGCYIPDSYDICPACHGRSEEKKQESGVEYTLYADGIPVEKLKREPVFVMENDRGDTRWQDIRSCCYVCGKSMSPHLVMENVQPFRLGGNYRLFYCCPSCGFRWHRDV